jgi:tetratricopeptide (TPR) repeat protein
MNSPALFSAHQDVLQAPIPVTGPEQERLWQELKTRAKGAVGSGQWPDALRLYTRALEVVTTDTTGGASSADNSFKTSREQAIMHSNISLMHSKMNDWDAAVESAEKAVAADASYVKAWWRLSQSQAGVKNAGAAVKAVKRGLELEPDNKALLKELEKLMTLQATITADAKATPKTVVSTSSSTASSSSSTPAPTTESQSHAGQPVKVEGVDFTKSDHVKGYKIVNGKKTSYFNNELSDQAAALIGDITPKKLETTTETGTTASTSATAKTTSAWNQAGTWEEKNVTAWAKQSLQDQLKATQYKLPASSPAPGALVTVTAAVITGDASVAQVRGKKRYLYEFSVVLDWKLEEHVVASGSLTFPDIDGTCVAGEPYECNDFKVGHMDDETIRPVLDQFVHSSGLRDALHESIDAWVRVFKETY